MTSITAALLERVFSHCFRQAQAMRLDWLAPGLQIDDVDIKRLRPLGGDHLTLIGRYRIALAEALRDRSAYRELNARPAVAA